MTYEDSIIRRQLEMAGHNWCNGLTVADNVLAFLSSENDFPGVPDALRMVCDARIVIANIEGIRSSNIRATEAHEPADGGITGIIHRGRAVDGAHRIIWSKENSVERGVFIELFP